MKMELTNEKRKGYVVCALMILVSCLYLVYRGSKTKCERFNMNCAEN